MYRVEAVVPRRAMRKSRRWWPPLVAGLIGLVSLTLWAAQARAEIYWAGPEFVFVARANDDGSGVSFIEDYGSPYDIAADVSHVYWSSPGGSAECEGRSSLVRANLDFSGRENGYICVKDPGSEWPKWVAVDSEHLYWTHPGGIARASIDGTEVEPEFIPLEGTALEDVEVYGNHIYWANRGTAIGRANLDGSGVEPAFIGPANSRGIAIGGGHIYWSNFEGSPEGDGSCHGTIGRANLDGEEVEPFFIGPLSVGPGQSFVTGCPLDVAADSSHLYWTNRESGKIGRADLEGGEIEPAFIPVAGGEAWGITVLPSSNQPPIADAGLDQEVSQAAEVTLDASASSDPNSDPLFFSWTQTGGSPVVLSDKTSSTPRFSAPAAAGPLTFQLKVCDPFTACTTDSVEVLVKAGSTVDVAVDIELPGHASAKKRQRTIAAVVSNVGEEAVKVCDTDLQWAIEVNGLPTAGTVSPKNSGRCRKVHVGGTARFTSTWMYRPGEVSAGSLIGYRSTVSVTGDAAAGNNSDTETELATK